MAKRTKTRTDGQRLLQSVVDGGRTVTWIAAICGVSQPAVSGWLSGRSRPDVEHRLTLEKHLGVLAEAWLTAAERRLASELELKRAAALGAATGTEG